MRGEWVGWDDEKLRSSGNLVDKIGEMGNFDGEVMGIPQRA